MSTSIPTQLRFPPFAGFTVRADFEGRALSSDFGPLLLRGDPYTDFLFGLTGNRRLKKRAEPRVGVGIAQTSKRFKGWFVGPGGDDEPLDKSRSHVHPIAYASTAELSAYSDGL